MRRALRFVVALAAVMAVVIPVAASAMPVPPPDGARVVSPGAFCAHHEAGDIGQTGTGLGMVCITTPTDTHLRWRELDPHMTPPVGSVYRLYLAYFLRHPDAGGMHYWIGLHADGYPLAAISQGFVNSAEFQSQYGSLDTPNFVRFVYLNVLGREPDPAGYDYWAHQVAFGGMPAASLMINFSESAEFRSNTGTV